MADNVQSFDGYIVRNLNNINNKIPDPKKVFEKIDNDQEIKPGALSYINGNMVYYDITSSDISSSLDLGRITKVEKLHNNITRVTTDNNASFDSLDAKKYIIVQRKDSNGLPQDIHRPYKAVNINKNNKTIDLKPVDMTTFKLSDTISADLKVKDKLVTAGVWKLLLSQSTQLNNTTKKKEGITREDLINQNKSIKNQINSLQTYLKALDDAGYSHDDPEYLKTKRNLDYQQALYNFNRALIDCESCDLNDSSTWSSNVNNKKKALDDAKKALNVPPPSTKEIIIKAIDKIALSVMGSIDIYFTGYKEDAPNPTTSSRPSWITNLDYTNKNTRHFKGKKQGFVGMNKNMGVNYAIFKGSYNADVGGTGHIKFVLDVAKAAGVASTRQNYKYEAFSALFKIKERNFWDYTGGQHTWQYFVNMTPVTNDPKSSDYGKFKIYCELSAYKDYHNAIIGARWFSTLNKFQGF